MNLLSHYKKLWFFNFNRLKGNNYELMRSYFAEILIDDIEEFCSLWDRRVLDVGGARGEFCKVLNDKRRCDAVNLDPGSKKELWGKSIRALADNIPFPDNEFDFIICRGVLEHIEPKRQQRSVDEMYRVTKPGGLCYIMIPPWYNPHAGHTFRPFHIFGFKVAKFLLQKLYKKKIDANSFAEEKLYPITFKKMAQVITASGFSIVATKDVHFRLHFLTRIPVLREIAVAAAGFILAKE